MTKNMKIIFKSEKETLAFAEKFAKKLRGGEVIALIGELGAGKTVFTKGLARGFGIRERVQSPTFLLMKIYDAKVRKNPSLTLPLGKGEKRAVQKIKYLCHVDAYRLSGAGELVGIGILDWFGRPDTVTVIEWADKVHEILCGKKVIKIKMKLGDKEEERIVEVTSNA